MRVYDLIKTCQDLTHLEWSESMQTSGSGGTFLKSREGVGAKATYYKLSCYDPYRGIYGHESVNEIVAARLMDVFGIEHASYRLIHANVKVDGKIHETWLCRSKSFRAEGERKQAFDLFYGLHRKEEESPLELCERYGWSKQIQQMMLVDYLIMNRDRHGANIEVLRSPEGQVRLAPLFDSGVSLLFSCHDDESHIRAFDPLADVRANNFIGTKSLEENLRFIAADFEVPRLCSDGRERILAGLECILPEYHVDKIWEIIWKRWQRFENLRNL